MQHGIVLPFGNAREVAEWAALAEQAGWDGIFVFEPVWGVDAWVALAAAAMTTERIRLGTMLTPIARMKPWKLASESATLDNLSNGRVIIAVGLGAPQAGYAPFNEITDRKLRAELTDEGLAILTGLWAGQPFSFSGKHYQITPSDFMPPPPPVQQPRIPIWVVGVAGSARSMDRALRYDGLLPTIIDGGPARAALPSELAEVSAAVRAECSANYAIIAEDETIGLDRAAAQAKSAAWAAAGATWLIDGAWQLSNDAAGRAALQDHIVAGPPRAV